MNQAWLNFTGFPQQNVLNQNFKDTTIKSADEQKETYFRISNYCRDWFAPPVFSNDVVPAPQASANVEVISVELKEAVKEGKADAPTDSKALTIPPVKIEESTLLNALLIGLGAALVVKIIS